MAVVALWVESVLFSVQTLSESMALACFLPAVVLLSPPRQLARMALAGFLMALAGLLRFQFAPAIAVFALLVAGRDWRMWKGLLHRRHAGGHRRGGDRPCHGARPL